MASISLAATTEEPGNRYQQDGSDDCCCEAADKSICGDIQLREYPAADYGAYESENRIRETSEPVPARN